MPRRTGNFAASHAAMPAPGKIELLEGRAAPLWRGPFSPWRNFP